MIQSMAHLTDKYCSWIFILGELNRAICWYLSCDRYWEDTKRQQRHTPWYLLTIFLVVLFSSIYVCYYIIWVLFKYVRRITALTLKTMLQFIVTSIYINSPITLSVSTLDAHTISNDITRNKLLNL